MRILVLSLFVLLMRSFPVEAVAQVAADTISRQTIEHAEKIVGLSFSDAKRDSMLPALQAQLRNYEALRGINLGNDVPPAFQFNPLPTGFTFPKQRSSITLSPVSSLPVPVTVEELAFASVRQLGEYIRTRKVTSLQLTTMYLKRLREYGPKLQCVVTLTESLAIAQAQQADREIAAGKYRGPLHGIPYGAKDLLATKGIPTTWGSAVYKNQIPDEDATVIARLRDAGAVLVAKLTLGELAWGDVWFGGKTRNPWNPEQGSSGSSAGSASATAAGLVAFSIGTETWGSIISPSTRCGTTGLRPTYGRISRNGAMALSWTMDKVGPICRTAEDCAIVFNAIYGPDRNDQTVLDAPFSYSPINSLNGLRIGYLKSDFDSAKNFRDQNASALQTLRSLGATLIPVKLPALPVDALSIILSAESAAAFDELTRSGRDSLLVRQIRNAWPNVFRTSRFIPAVEYIQANRIRHLLIQHMHALMSSIDMYVAPSIEGENLLLTNLTGHPTVVVPSGFTEAGTPTSISFTGRLFDEGRLLALADAFQQRSDFHLQQPPLTTVRKQR